MSIDEKIDHLQALYNSFGLTGTQYNELGYLLTLRDFQNRKDR